MKRAVLLIGLTLIGGAAAAPRLPSKAEFLSATAEGRYVVVERTATEQFKVSFSVAGKKGTTYTVELHVEPYSTGERAILVQAATVATDSPLGAEAGMAYGSMSAGTRYSRIKALAELPNVGKGYGWSYCLVLKEGDAEVARTSFVWVHYPGRPD